ncbi:aldehyde dehydrogenase [Paracoccus sp. SCSIO 75233]|uniref:aldehyde dehydrogenase family protein n=1 Tax=Paracoccus sp. SCSIO 75233 TaxID=3017782 RepID=UPI0022F025C0|nr:aldehyde dehydrogenase family protein [Paracoccus sp. SCSIO 75233]WBU52425.1 aldehyde dehydrogenase family protein [Paracoccus sp. SCSIO 75233]
MTFPEFPFPPFLQNPAKDLYIGGRSRLAADGRRFDTYNPGTGEVLASLARGSAADIDHAVAVARTAFTGPWSRFTPAERQETLLRIAKIIEERFDELAMVESLDVGAPLSRVAASKTAIGRVVRYFSAQALQCRGETFASPYQGNVTSMILKAPVGVVGGIIPWNAPLYSIWWILGGVLATGCTVVIKPAEDASLSSLLMAEVIADAGVPEGVVNIVTGTGAEAGSALALHPDVDRLAFTGSTATAREIIKSSAGNMKRLQLETGGKSPDIIFEDANLNKAVPGAAMGVFNNSGQICYAGTRIFVQRSIQQDFLSRLAAFTGSLKVGHPFDTDTVLGPVVSQGQLERVMKYIEIGQNEGATLVTGGERLSGDLAQGYYITPTVFADVTSTMRIAREEIFGPVVSVIPFESADDVLAMANDTEYGLGGAVWTRSLEQAMRMVHGIQAGQVWVNCYGLVDPMIGFGGVKNSGYGWKGGSRHVDGYLYEKAVTINAD